MPEKLRLAVPMVLPTIEDHKDRCVQRLSDALLGRDGVEEVHVTEAIGQGPAQLCIHYDADVLPLQRIRRIAELAGARLSDRFRHLVWELRGITHPRRGQSVAQRLRRIGGVVEAAVSAAGRLRLELDLEKTNEDAVRGALRSMGVEIVVPGPPEDHDGGEAVHDHAAHAAHGGIFGERTELVFAIVSGVLLGVGWLLSLSTSVPDWGPVACYVAAYLCGGFFIVRELIEHFRLEIELLMLLAAVGAAFLGEWAEGALLLVLFNLGHALEAYAMGRARRAIAALGELAPPTALVRRNARETEVPVEELAIGDVVIVKANERIAADGFVVKGRSSVNQAPVTGESVPADKRPVPAPAAALANPAGVEAEQRVFAGTINGRGALEIVVLRAASDTTVARVVRMVTEAETAKSPTQRLTERFERIFVPAVLGLVVLLLFAWVVIDEPFSGSFYRAMAVLVAASPCALAIATPSAVLSGVARAGRGGVLVKGGAPLEGLGTLTAVGFDKTGTLTEGKPRLTDVVPANGVAEAELLRIAVSVEKLSGHPLAAAVVRDGAERLHGAAAPQASALRSITGRGIEARIDGQPVYIGKDELFLEIEGPPPPGEIREAVERLEQAGRTTMVVRHADRYLGVLGLMDTARAPAADVIAHLRRLGIRRTVLISGDNQRVTEAVAREVGIDEAWGDLLPEDKVRFIKELRQREGAVAMVGDGVNDAPAMANATVGIAMGAAGSDVALETADVALMADDLRHLPFAVGLSRKTSRIIKQNLFVSLGMVAVLVPATVLGLGIGPAVALHEGSTLLVVGNALRLLAYRDAA